MKWVGLTGGIATGKSTTSNILRSQYNLPVIDADELAKQALNVGEAPFKAVVQHFGPGILQTDQQIDRAKLAQLVFTDVKNRLVIESYIHPYVQKKMQELKQHYQSRGAKSCLYDVPLLFEKNLESQFDQTILVYSPKNLQVERIRLRNPTWSDAEIEQRLKSQLDIEVKRTKANYIIENVGTLDDLQKQIAIMVQTLQL